jgi:hypothetical protein
MVVPASPRSLQLLRQTDDHLPTPSAQKFDGRFDLWPHTAGEELASREVVLRLCHAEPSQRSSSGAGKIEVDAIDVGQDEERFRLQFAGEQTAGEVLVDHRLDTEEAAIRAADNGHAATAHGDRDEILVQ